MVQNRNSWPKYTLQCVNNKSLVIIQFWCVCMVTHSDRQANSIHHPSPSKTAQEGGDHEDQWQHIDPEGCHVVVGLRVISNGNERHPVLFREDTTLKKANSLPWQLDWGNTRTHATSIMEVAQHIQRGNDRLPYVVKFYNHSASKLHGPKRLGKIGY